MRRGYIFDLDGTIYLDDDFIPGVPEAIQSLKTRGDKVVFLTNKSIARRKDYVTKLNGMGIEVELNEVINSNYITALYLKNDMVPGDAAYVIGEEPLVDELLEAGIELVEDATGATHVVVGWDRQFTYEKLNHAFQAWRNGAEIIATNPDRTCPIQGGEIPDCGAMIGALEGATGEPVKQITGKPSSLMSEYVLSNVLKMEADQCYMVGDRLETDIRMANEAGIHSVLVMTGITTDAMLETATDRPSFVLESVRDIASL
ncbi:HAD-IIA family hydrolase [Sporosarcina sp. Sa2YVA2]|uniref:Acid sugar phosphatase n=1 Tax=Sporosarcina quadrami TaxID=2762234 RepID=A0ABR8U8Z8_9BACL|nr:HAD-IIA family hydrolase [Sporosarcina quadrami]MBD7984501.1 HAD-IIA family hydrolase [Sporosarcina quadrami]